MLYTVKSHKPIAEIQRRLDESAARHQFGILTVHNLRETMRKKGVEFGMDSFLEPSQAVPAASCIIALMTVSTS